MDKTKLYYIDGYHGGIRGHMPLGCWRDILEMLKTCPEWKLSIDVEPISWDFLQARDPAAYEELSELLRDQSIGSRLEMVSGSYAQPYGWITDGESNIRHLTMGIDTLKGHFPWIDVKTYAVQEPCWTSALPQMLKSLRFERAVLKNPSTAWGGYSAGFDAETCIWEGPDGTTIPLVPRYACEELLNVWETESVNGEKDFAEKCAGRGIPHPAGMYYQDLGWRANPRMSNKPGYEGTFFPDYIEYSTWKEYFEQIADKPDKTWKVTQEAFQGALPWGERILVRMARQVRRLEAGLLNSERLNALSAFLGGKRDSGAKLGEAWAHLLLTQHHDGWVCAGAGRGERNWAWLTSAQVYAAENIIAPVNRHALYSIGKSACPAVEKNGAAEMLCVVNPLGNPEYRAVKAEMTSARGAGSFIVYDGDEALTSQYIHNRLYADGSKNAGYLLFNAYFPGFGAKAFRIEPSSEADKKGVATAGIADGAAFLENGYYRITFDLNAGGVISSLYDKRRGVEVVDAYSERKFNEYYGYFISESKFISSAECAAKAEAAADGPVYASLTIKGKIGPAGYTQTIGLTEGDAKIYVRVVFHFPEKTYIGEPYEIVPEGSMTEGHRSYHDGRYKLNAYFPTAFEQRRIFKDAAYDVCESGHADTYFKHWNEIKHNILIGWVDASDGKQGLAIMSDHTTSYIHGSGCPLGLTMAWGWDGGFWWGRRQLKGDHELVYAIMPHDGDWQDGGVWHEYQKMIHPPISQRIAGITYAPQLRELISVGRPVEMSAAYLDKDGRMMARLFNPGKPVNAAVEIDAGAAGLVEITELDGKEICRPDVTRESGKAILTVHMPEFGIRTLRITQIRAAEQ